MEQFYVELSINIILSKNFITLIQGNWLNLVAYVFVNFVIVLILFILFVWCWILKMVCDTFTWFNVF